MEKLSRFQNVLFGNAPKILILIVVLILFNTSAKAQLDHSAIAGNWFEVYKKKKSYYLPLQIQFNNDQSAKYINRYPERSYNLTFTLSSDSSLSLSNGEKYKIVFLNERLMKLFKTGIRTAKTITLRKAFKEPK